MSAPFLERVSLLAKDPSHPPRDSTSCPNVDDDLIDPTSFLTTTERNEVIVVTARTVQPSHNSVSQEIAGSTIPSRVVEGGRIIKVNNSKKRVCMRFCGELLPYRDVLLQSELVSGHVHGGVVRTLARCFDTQSSQLSSTTINETVLRFTQHFQGLRFRTNSSESTEVWSSTVALIH